MLFPLVFVCGDTNLSLQPEEKNDAPVTKLRNSYAADEQNSYLRVILFDLHSLQSAIQRNAPLSLICRYNLNIRKKGKINKTKSQRRAVCTITKPKPQHLPITLFNVPLK